jgi:hypothetical protein
MYEYASHPHEALLVVTNSPVIVGLTWITRNVQEEMAMVLVSFKFRRLGTYF